MSSTSVVWSEVILHARLFLFFTEQLQNPWKLKITALDVRPSVCLSVTLVICIKMVQARITKSSLWAASRTLVFSDKILCPWVPPLKDVILPLLALIV